MLESFGLINGLRRWICGRIRIVLLLRPDILGFLSDSSFSWHRHPNHFYRPGGRILDFDATLGYPGEGPTPSNALLPTYLIFHCWLSLAAGFSCPVPGFAPSYVTIMSFSGFQGVIGAPARWADGDGERKAARSGIVLRDARRVTAGTSNVRQVLLETFLDWLRDGGSSPDILIFLHPLRIWISST